MKEIGGFKNMLKRWRINLKNKKKKENKELEEKKNKHPKLTGFVYNTIAIIIMPIGYLLEKPKSKKRKIEPKKENDIKKVKNNIEEKIKESKENNIDISKNKEEQIEEKIKTIKEEKQINKEGKILKEDKCFNKISDISKEENDKNMDNNVQPKIDESIILSPLISPFLVKQASLKEKKDDNKKLDYGIIYNKRIEEITEKVKDEKNKEKLLELSEELEKLKKEVSETENFDNTEILEKINKQQEIIKNKLNPDKEIKLEDLVNKESKIILSQIDIKLEENKEINKIANKGKKENKKENEKQKKEKEKLLQAKDIIDKQIIYQKKLLEELKKNLELSVNKSITFKIEFFKRKGFFNKLLLPFFFFDSLISSLLTGILLSNSIKTLRYIINPNITINYKTFEIEYFKLLKDTDYLLKLFNSSKYEINKLKEDIKSLNIQDDYLNKQIEEIENKIDNQLKVFEKTKQNIEKTKVKVKVLEWK